MDKISEYVPSTKTREAEIEIVITMMLSAVVAYFFYRSFWGLFTIVPVFFFVRKVVSEEFAKRRKSKCLMEFKEMLLSVSASLRAGYSLENAIRDVESDFAQIYGDGSLLIDDISCMIKKLSLHVTIERAFLEFAETFPYEEIESFAFMISFAKRLGGNYVKNIRDAADKLSARLDLKREIESEIAEKRIELRVMSAMPIGIIIYMGITAGDFMEGLYHNVTGVLVMSVCLVIYLVCILIGERIINIEY